MIEVNPLLYSQFQLRNLPKEQWGGNFKQNTQWPLSDYYWQNKPLNEQLTIVQSLSYLTLISLHCKAIIRRMQEQNPNKNQPWLDTLARPKVRERIQGHKIAEKRQNLS